MIVRKMRGLVSKNKRRFKEGDFDLDLSYILDNIIAMGFPSEGSSALIRNSMEEVQRFLDTRHPHQYKVYNLCSERECVETTPLCLSLCCELCFRRDA